MFSERYLNFLYSQEVISLPVWICITSILEGKLWGNFENDDKRSAKLASK